jgi:hypothetical protein
MVFNTHQSLFRCSKWEEYNGRAGSTYGERKGTSRVLVGKHEGKRSLARPGRKREILITWIFRK